MLEDLGVWGNVEILLLNQSNIVNVQKVRGENCEFANLTNNKCFVKMSALHLNLTWQSCKTVWNTTFPKSVVQLLLLPSQFR